VLTLGAFVGVSSGSLIHGDGCCARAASAQQPAVPVVRFIRDGSAEANARNAVALRRQHFWAIWSADKWQ
jgi:hypothetical protein